MSFLSSDSLDVLFFTITVRTFVFFLWFIFRPTYVDFSDTPIYVFLNPRIINLEKNFTGLTYIHNIVRLQLKLGDRRKREKVIVIELKEHLLVGRGIEVLQTHSN